MTANGSLTCTRVSCEKSVLSAKRLSQKLNGRLILDSIDLEVRGGEIATIFGANGAGKTTLLRILSTLVKPTSGTVLMDGIDAHKNLSKIRPLIGLVIHEPLAYLELSPYENLKFLGKLYGIRWLEKRIEQLLRDVGLFPFAHEPIKVFSRGMTQRFMIAKALLHDPKYLFFDEPFSGLDSGAKDFMLQQLEQERQANKVILLTTHNIELGHLSGSQFYSIENGKISEN